MMAPLDLLQYTEHDRIALLKEFNRTPETVTKDIECIKAWLEKQPHLPETPGDGRIEKFLFIGKFIFAKVKTTIDLYYTTRSLLPEFFKDPDCEEMRNIFEIIYFLPLPKLTANRCRVIIQRMRKAPSNVKLDPCAYFSYCINLADIFINEDCPCSKVIVCDGTNASIDLIVSFSPGLIRKAMIVFEKVFSHRIQQIHIVNMPLYLESLLLLVKSCMNPKIAQRIQIHKDTKSLSSFIPRDILPADYGGEEKSLEMLHGLWRRKFQETAPSIRRRNLLKTNEALRVGQPIDNEMLGIEGNFRKLDVD